MMFNYAFLLLMLCQVSHGFKWWGWDGCGSTDVPREQVDEVGVAFYSLKMDADSGMFYKKGQDQEYVIIPNNRHLYGWYYRKVDVLNQLDAGVLDIVVSGADVKVPGTTFNFFGIENMMAVHQEGLWTEEDENIGLQDQAQVLEEFGDEPYDYETENDYKRMTEVLNHTLGVQMNFQFLVALYDMAQVQLVKSKKSEVPDNTEYREKLRQFTTNDIGNVGEFNKTGTNCLHIEMNAKSGCEIGKDWMKIVLNKKFVTLKGETIFAPANILQGVVAETYFTINQATQSLEITLKYFASLQTDLDSHPLTAKFFQGHPHTPVDLRYNPVGKDDVHPFCDLAEVYSKKRIDKRFLWRPRDQVCPEWLDEEFKTAVKPIWQMSGDPEDKPKGEDWDYMIDYMAKYLPCSIDYLQGMMDNSGGFQFLEASVWCHFVLEVPPDRAYKAAADLQWSNFYHVDYIYGNQEENSDIVKGQYRGMNWCDSDQPCGDGEGNCESYDDCLAGLFCHHRTQGSEYVRGYDLTHIDPEVNVCINGSPKITVTERGFGNKCSRKHPCMDGEGDCDADSDCADGLRCFKRTYGEELGGYDTSGVWKTTDFCVPATECPMGEFSHDERCSCTFENGDGALDEICGLDQYCTRKGCIQSPEVCYVENWMNTQACICGENMCQAGEGCEMGECLDTGESYSDYFTPVDENEGIGGAMCIRNVAFTDGASLDTLTMHSPFDCQEECNKYTKCVVWDWEKPTKTCTLRSSEGEAQIAYLHTSGIHGGVCPDTTTVDSTTDLGTDLSHDDQYEDERNWLFFTDTFVDQNCEEPALLNLPHRAALGGCGSNGAGKPVVYECFDQAYGDEHISIIETPYTDTTCTTVNWDEPKMLWTRGACYTLPEGAVDGVNSYIVNWKGKTPCPESWANSGLVSKLCQLVNCDESDIAVGQMHAITTSSEASVAESQSINSAVTNNWEEFSFKMSTFFIFGGVFASAICMFAAFRNKHVNVVAADEIDEYSTLIVDA